MDSEGKIDHDKKGMVAGMVMWQQELVGELFTSWQITSGEVDQNGWQVKPSKTHPYPQPSKTVAPAEETTHTNI